MGCDRDLKGALLIMPVLLTIYALKLPEDWYPQRMHEVAHCESFHLYYTTAKSSNCTQSRWTEKVGKVLIYQPKMNYWGGVQRKLAAPCVTQK